VDRSAYDRFFVLETTHFWRIAKRRLALEWLRRYGPPPGGLRLLDIGGACSLIPKELERWGQVQVIELDADTAQFARARLGLDVREGRFPDDAPVRGSFDVVTMLDVLEHIEDDGASLRAARGLLKPEGILLVTVPALSWLWSDHDVVLHHCRRYTRGELTAKLEGAGFSVPRISYYTSLLLPELVAERMVDRLRSSITGRRKATYDVKPPPGALNSLFGVAMSFERRMLRSFDCWLGSSLIAAARPRPAESVSGGRPFRLPA
jgi:2-polyprenyl-3-methyl-5-hydroxy-6-metoxy-1,4-benzoquinol methylase